MAYKKILIKINADNLKAARKKAGLSQIQLAELTGLKQEYISYLETGVVKSVRQKTYDKINKIIKITT